MTRIQVPQAARSVGLDELLATEVGYHQLIQWLASLDPTPLRRALDLPEGALIVLREGAVSDRCVLDLVFYVDDIPSAVAQMALGRPTRIDDKWVFDQWCAVRGITPDRRHVLSLTGDVIAAWSEAPGWREDVTILGLLEEWRDTSELVFVRELANHAHALADEVVLQTRGTLAHVESRIARYLIAKQLRIAFREHYPAGSGVEFPLGPIDRSPGSRAALRVPVPSGGHLMLQVEPRGGTRAKPGCDWGITILAAVGEEFLLPDETEALALLAVPSFSLDRLRERLDEHGLCHLASRLSAAKLPSGTKLDLETFDSTTNPTAKRWHDRFRVGKRPLAGPSHPLLYGDGSTGLGVQFYVESSLTADELQAVVLTLAEMLRETAPALSSPL